MAFYIMKLMYGFYTSFFRRSRMSKINLTFAVCAYKENSYLEEAVESVINQTLRCNVIIVTATPNDYIKSISDKYEIPMLINNSNNAVTMSGNWNFAYKSATTDYVTIVHQDDYYEPKYAEEVLKKAKGKKPIIVFSDYFELRNGNKIFKNRLLKVKRLMNMGYKLFPGSRFVRRSVLSLGNSICCPAVTFFKPLCGDFRFDSNLKNNLDWDAWIRLADKKGQFLYINKPLMGHRIHLESSTTENIESGARLDENLTIFKRFWPEWFAEKLLKIYETSDKSNKL